MTAGTPPGETITLTGRTAGAAQWRFAASIVGVFSQFVVGVILARLLMPADFGLMALALIVLGVARPLADLGVGNALVQRAGLTERHIRSAFMLSAGLGAIVALVVAATAARTSLLLGDTHVAPVLRLLAIGFAFQGIAVVATALLRRDLDFKKQFFIDTASYLLGYGGCSTALALLGYGVWSLAWGTIAQMIMASTARLFVRPHPIAPLLAARELKELLAYGVGSAGISGVNYVALNGDNFVVGRWLGPANLGLYTRAYALMNAPHLYAANVMSGVLFPALAQVQSEPDRLRRAYLVGTRLTATIAAPMLGALAIAAPHLVESLYGPRWSGVARPLQILAVAGYFRTLYNLGGIVAQSVGRVYNELRRQIVYATLVIAGAMLGSRVSLEAVALGVTVAIAYMFVASTAFALKVTATSWRAYVAVQRTAFVAAAVTCAAAMGLRLLLEAWHASSAVITLAIVAAAAVPWAAGLLSTLAEPDLESLRAQLPPWLSRLSRLFRARAL